eukprot:910358-Pleurochrysis_carterae.AAC.2
MAIEQLPFTLRSVPSILCVACLGSTTARWLNESSLRKYAHGLTANGNATPSWKQMLVTSRTRYELSHVEYRQPSETSIYMGLES